MVWSWPHMGAAGRDGVYLSREQPSVPTPGVLEQSALFRMLWSGHVSPDMSLQASAAGGLGGKGPLWLASQNPSIGREGSFEHVVY